MDEGLRTRLRWWLAEATGAARCRACGCFHKAIDEAEAVPEVAEAIAATLARAREERMPERHDCIGCKPCYPTRVRAAIGKRYGGTAAVSDEGEDEG